MFVRISIPSQIKALDTEYFENMQIELVINKCPTTILAIYRPPSLNEHSFIDELERVIGGVGSKRNMLIIGDMNIDTHKTTNIVSDYLELMASNGLLNCIMQSTRVDIKNETRTCIDHLHVRYADSDIYAGVMQTNISDNYAILSSINICGNALSTQELRRKVLMDNRVTHMIKWSDPNEIDDVDDMYRGLTAAFGHIYNCSMKIVAT